MQSPDVFAQACDSENRASVTVEYGGAQRVTYQPSNDGTLTAIDADSGATLWAFGTEGDGVSVHRVDRMTDVRVLRFDANHDGTIDISSGDKVWLYFGTRRSGTLYYALDVSDRSLPRVLWKIGADVLEGAGDAWSTPTIARVRVAGAAQNGEHFVLILGGGYAEAPSALGNRVFMVDAATGRLLWYAGGPGDASAARTPDLLLPPMQNPFPARVAAVDTDGDQFADRLYAVDVAGQVWRFDVWNGRNRAALVTGGVLAELGSPAGAQRFFNAPDVALIQHRGAAPYYNLALGSGGKGALGVSASDNRFYSIRDRQPFTRLTQSAYDDATPIVDTDLTDITGAVTDVQVPAGSAGWKLELNAEGRVGEQVLSESLTANGVVLFTTYEPAVGDESGCAVGGTGRVYAVREDSGGAVLDLDDDQSITSADLSKQLVQQGVPGSPILELPRKTAAGPLPGAPDEPEAQTRCRVGDEVLSSCVEVGAVIRTFWQLQLVK